MLRPIMMMAIWSGMFQALTGCSRGSGTDATSWSEWRELNTFHAEGQLKIAYPAAAGRWQEVKKAASSPEFRAAVDAFAKAPAPPAWREREQAREAAVSALHALIRAAEQEPPAALRTRYEVAHEALSAIYR